MSRRTSWFLVVLWVGLIYTTLPVMRDLVNLLKAYSLRGPLTLALNGVGGLGLALLVWRGRGRWSSYNLVVIVLLVGIMAYGVYVVEYPEERLHFLEYGILGALCFRALNHDLSPGWAFLGAFALAAGVGWGDEGIQYLLPRRHYDLRDVAMNATGALLGSLLIYQGLPWFQVPSRERSPE